MQQASTQMEEEEEDPSPSKGGPQGQAQRAGSSDLGVVLNGQLNYKHDGVCIRMPFPQERFLL
jgi:hypothetical protein